MFSKKSIRIVVTGPESSGKTTLAKALAKHFGIDMVPEFARQYLNENGPSYSFKDLGIMAQGQLQLEKNYQQQENSFLICDTDILTYKIWSEYKYGHVESRILTGLESVSDSLYLLCAPDIPWEADPLRENPMDRYDIYDLYEENLDFYNLNFIKIEGGLELRIKDAIFAIQNFTQLKTK